MAIASTGCSVSDITEVGASAAASRSVKYPKDAACLIRLSEFLVLETFDCPVRANSDGAVLSGW